MREETRTNTEKTFCGKKRMHEKKITIVELASGHNIPTKRIWAIVLGSRMYKLRTSRAAETIPRNVKTFQIKMLSDDNNSDEHLRAPPFVGRMHVGSVGFIVFDRNSSIYAVVLCREYARMVFRMGRCLNVRAFL